MITFRYRFSEELKTTPQVGTVEGAKQEGSMQVVRRQISEGFWVKRPEGVEDPAVLIVVPDVGQPLLPIVKNIVDGLDSMGVIHDDRQVFRTEARIGKTDDETLAEVTYLEPCSRKEEGCEESCTSKRKAFGCTLLISAHARATAFPTGSIPLVSPTGEYVSRDVDGYVATLRADAASLETDEPEALAELKDMMAAAAPLRVRIHLETPAFADIENIATLLVHLMHVAVYGEEKTTAQEVWDAAPSVESLIREITILRTDPTSSCRLATITVEDANTPTEDPIADTSLLELLVPRPQ